MASQIFDIVVIGGGINGAGIAADAAGRGLRVLLAEKGDLAGGTSCASSKLIHGGLRYLEHLDFRLVRHALIEREVLLAKAPHIIRPLRFVLPHGPGQRPRWMLSAGLFLYDHLAPRRQLQSSRTIHLSNEPAGEVLKAGLNAGFAYWDCAVDDARLVVLNARQAADKGATILTRTAVTKVHRDGPYWIATLADGAGEREVAARALVNAAGPWVGSVDETARAAHRGIDAACVRLVKGSHIVVPRIGELDQAILLQACDGRVVFVLPFERRFTLIGTTDVTFEGDPGGATISLEERDYLLGVANTWLRVPLLPKEIVWSFAGVRPLYDDKAGNPSAVTRDYRLELAGWPQHPPLLTVIGGKITTYRRLAEDALRLLALHLPAMGQPWTASTPLPGGDLGGREPVLYLGELHRSRPGFAPEFLERLFNRHGAMLPEILGDAKREADLGDDLGGGLTEAEVRYLAQREWARTPDDVLWRRTKCGLHMDAGQRQKAAERIARLL